MLRGSVVDLAPAGPRNFVLNVLNHGAVSVAAAVIVLAKSLAV